MATAAIALAGCTVKSFDSGRAPATPAQKVETVHAVFAESPSFQGKSNAAIDGLIAMAANASLEQRARSAMAEDKKVFVQTFTEGFKDKLPAIATRYGLTVSDAAQAEFGVVVNDQATTCSLYGCVSRFSLHGELLDPSGKSFWHFDTKIGQASIFATIPELFDAFATEALDAMKKDGVIGG